MNERIVIGKTYRFDITKDIPLLKIVYDKDESTETIVMTIKSYKPIDKYIIDYHLSGWTGDFDFHKKFIIYKNDLLKILIDNKIL